VPSLPVQRRRVSLCVLDLDNTLWDWVAMWGAMFRAMLDEVIRLSGLPEEVLLPEFRAIHQRHGTAEYAFAIQELPSLRAKHPGADIKALYDPAMHAYYRARKMTLVLYPGVEETLLEIHNRGCRLVAYTESMAFYSASRLRYLGLDELIDFMYSPADHELPRDMRPEDIRQYPADYYVMRRTQQRQTPKGELKPNPDILRTILQDLGSEPRNTIYVGDSKMKDIVMANQVGVTSVWAEYGIAQHTTDYQLLRQVTHWSDEDVQRERLISEGVGVDEKDLAPALTIQTFGELLDAFEFDSPGEEGR